MLECFHFVVFNSASCFPNFVLCGFLVLRRKKISWLFDWHDTLGIYVMISVLSGVGRNYVFYLLEVCFWQDHYLPLREAVQLALVWMTGA